MQEKISKRTKYQLVNIKHHSTQTVGDNITLLGFNLKSITILLNEIYCVYYPIYHLLASLGQE